MARGKDLKLTPGHDGQQPALASISPRNDTKFRSPDILSDDPKAQIEARDLQYDDQQDEDDVAEEFAGLINDASLSGVSHESPATASKRPESFIRQIISTYWSNTPHKQPKTFQENTNSKLHINQRQVSEQVLRSPEQELSTIAREVPAPASLENETVGSAKKPKAVGRPDIYDTPQSPPKSPAVETKANNDRNRKIHKSKTLLVREKVGNKGIQANEGAFLNDLDAAEQEYAEVAEQATSLSTTRASVTAEQITSPQRITRSSSAKEGKSIAHSQRPKRTTPQSIERSPEFGRPSVSQIATAKAKRGRPGKDQIRINQPQRPTTDSAVIGDSSAHSDVNSMSRISQIGEYENLQRDAGERFGIRATTGSEEVAGEERVYQLHSGDVSDILMNPSPTKATQQPPPPKQARKLNRPSGKSKNIQGSKKGRSSQHMSQTYQEPGLVHSKDLEKPRPTIGRYQAETLDSSDYYDISDGDDDNLMHEPDVSNIGSGQSTAEQAITANSYLINEQTMDEMLSHMKNVGRHTHEDTVAPDEIFTTAIGRQMSKAAEKLASTYILLEELKSADAVDLQKVQLQQQKALALLAKLEALVNTMLNDRLGDRSSGGKNEDDAYRKNMLRDLYMHIIPKAVDALHASAKRYWKQSTLDTVELQEFTALLKVVFELAKAARAEGTAVQPKPPKSHSYQLSRPTRLLLPVVRKLFRKCRDELAAREARKMAAERERKRKQQESADEVDYLRRLKERNRAILISLNKSRAQLGLPPSGQQDGARTSNQPYWDTTHSDASSDRSDDAEHERLSLFGRNNSHPEKIPREWTREEMEVLVDVLWRERGPTRYEKLAMRLDRTMDEIFERAKYFKQQVQYTINRKQEENPDVEHATMEPWVENIGHEF